MLVSTPNCVSSRRWHRLDHDHRVACQWEFQASSGGSVSEIGLESFWKYRNVIPIESLIRSD